MLFFKKLSPEMGAGTGEGSGDPQPKQGAQTPANDVTSTPTGDPQSPNKKANEEARKFRQERNELKVQFEKLQADFGEMSKTLKAEQTARQEAEKKALDAAKVAAAARYGLSDKLAERLVGATAEEIEADAKALAETLPTPSTPKPPSPGNPAGGETTFTLDQIKAMSPAQIEANLEAVKAALAKK